MYDRLPRQDYIISLSVVGCDVSSYGVIWQVFCLPVATPCWSTHDSRVECFNSYSLKKEPQPTLDRWRMGVRGVFACVARSTRSHRFWGKPATRRFFCQSISAITLSGNGQRLCCTCQETSWTTFIAVRVSMSRTTDTPRVEVAVMSGSGRCVRCPNILSTLQ